MQVRYFRSQVVGPEIELENKLIPQLENIFSDLSPDCWAGAYLPLGSSRPDLLIAAYHPDISSLCDIPISATKILGCLKVIPRARAATLSAMTGIHAKQTVDYLGALEMVGVVKKQSQSYTLTHSWRNILPTVLSIELKVKDWRKAVYQAITNRTFTHMSLIALPESVATRIRNERVILKYGIGILSISDNCGAQIIRKPRRSKPQVWPYYYRLASVLATDCMG